jgi:hypothetical protein
LRHVVDDIAQPRMRGLVVKPSRPDHGGFDRFGRTVFVDRLVEARLLETLGPAALAGAAFLYDFPAGEIASVVVAQILGSPEAQRPAVAVNDIAVLALPNPSVIIRALREAMPRIRSELAV